MVLALHPVTTVTNITIVPREVVAAEQHALVQMYKQLDAI
jgi:hypothetical protein